MCEPGQVLFKKEKKGTLLTNCTRLKRQGADFGGQRALHSAKVFIFFLLLYSIGRQIIRGACIKYIEIQTQRLK